MKKVATISGIIGIVLCGAFTARQQSADELADAISKYFFKRPMEKVFLHLDKPYYAAGDDLWYAAYVNNYLTGKPSNLSGVLHVELLDHKGNSILQQKTRISNGLANGLMELPDTLMANYYSVKAYTNWARNFEEGLFFNHVIKVVSPNFEPTESPTENSIQFYAEGGHILNGKLNNVAFISNKKTRTNAYLLNNLNDTLDDFAYDGKGFGILKLLPESPDTEYYLKFENDDNFHQLPAANSIGTTLRLQEKTDAFNLFIEGSDEFFGKRISIILLNNGNIVSAFDRKLNASGLFLVFRKNDLPNGLNHLMLFSDQNTLLNQRLFSNSNQNPSSELKIQMEKKVETREEIKININSNYQAASHVSVSVTPLQYFGHAQNPNISNITSSISSTKDSFSRNEYLIAEKITAYDPKSIIDTKEPTFDYAIQGDDIFEINIEMESYNQIQSKADIFSISLKNGDSVNLYFAPVEDTNHLTLVVPSFSGVKDLILKPYLSDKESNFKYKLKKSIGNEPINKAFSQNTTESDYAKEIRENKVLRRLYNIDYKKQMAPQTEPYSFRVLKSFDKKILLNDYIILPTMKEVFKELLPCARMKETRSGNITIQLCDNDQFGEYLPFMEREAFRLIDGVPIFDSEIIANLDPLKIKSISTIYRKLNLDGVEMNGVLQIVTHEGNFGKTNNLGHSIFSFQGYSDKYEFISPEINSLTPDFRSTLYWNPEIIVEANKSASISFTASDEIGDYRIEIQGITEDGIPIYYETYFTVM